MRKIKFSFRLTGAAVCTLLAVFMLAGCATFSGRSVDNPKRVIVDFIDAMQADKFDRNAADTAMSCIANYSTMGFEKYAELGDSELEKTLFDLLRNSYSVEFSDSSLDPVSSPYQGKDMTISGTQAFVRFSFTSLDISQMSEPLSDIVTEIGAERMYEGEVYETEADAAALVEEVFTGQFISDGDVSDYCAERRLTLELAYSDGGWKIVVSDEFYDALLGK